jgi:hypothetical protein
MQRKVMSRLMGLQFRIQYKKRVDNSAADALSRVTHVHQLLAISEDRPVWIQEVLNSYVTDGAAQEKLQRLAIHSPDPQGFALEQGLIKVHGKIWVGANSAVHTKLINAFHNSAMGGHSGVLPTYQRLKRLFSWSGMKGEVEDFVKQCAICQQAKHNNMNLPASCNPCRSHLVFGVNSPWTSSKGCRSHLGQMSLWLWWIV